MTAHCIRLPPGTDLVPALQECARQAMATTTAIQSANNSPSTASSLGNGAIVLTAVGSLEAVTLRMASAPKQKKKNNDKEGTTTNDIRVWNNQCFEIVSLVGTFDASGAKHLHMSLSDRHGETIGGHLVAGTVYTTVELVLGTVGGGVVFTRRMDAATGYNELYITKEGQQDTNDEGMDGTEIGNQQT